MAKDLNRRLSTLQCGNPRELKLIAHFWYEGDPKVVEDFVHTQFSHKRILREWYALTMEERG